jgi:hypothetical protein
MKNSNFHRLLERYVTESTSARETAKIEALLAAIKRKKIQFLSEETEEFLFRKISNDRISPVQITQLVKKFSKLKIGAVNWLRMKSFQVYFYKEIIS